MKNTNYITILAWMGNLKLSLVEKTIFAIIYGFSQDEDSEFHGSRQYLADWCEASTKTVDRALAHLVELGYIHKREKVVGGVKFCRYSVDVHTVDKMSLLGTNWENGRDKMGEATDKMSHNNIVDNADNKLSANRDNIERAPAFDFKKALMDLGISEQTAADWLAVRKNAKATNTQTTFNALKTQIEKIVRRYGVTAEQVAAFAVGKDWKAINAEWDEVKQIKNAIAAANNGGYDPSLPF